jgi:hypothetical protein
MNFPAQFLERLDISFLSGEFIAHLLFFLIALFTLILSLVLFFHWRKYGLGGGVLAITELVYLGVSLFLLTTAFFAI